MKLLNVVFIIATYVIPPLLLAFGLIDVSSRYELFLGITVLLLIESIITERYKHIRVIGNWKRSLKYNAVVSILIVMSGFILYRFELYPQEVTDSIRGLPSQSFAFFYVLASVGLQQWLYFGYLRNRVKEIVTSPMVQGIIIASLYSLLHIYYPDNVGVLVSTFIFGLVLYSMTYKSNSIAGNVITHSIFGLIAFALNFA